MLENAVSVNQKPVQSRSHYKKFPQGKSRRLHAIGGFNILYGRGTAKKLMFPLFNSRKYETTNLHYVVEVSNDSEQRTQDSDERLLSIKPAIRRD